MLEIDKKYRVKNTHTVNPKWHGRIVTVRSLHHRHAPTLATCLVRDHGVDRDVAFYETELEPANS